MNKTLMWIVLMCALDIFLLLPVTCNANTPAQNAKILTQTAIKLGVEPAVMLAYGMKESKLRDKAYNANPKGKGDWDVRESHGVLQPTFANAKAYGCKTVKELYDAKKCALYAGRFIKDLLKKYYPKYSLATISEIYNLGETRFFKGKTAHKYSQEWQKYYELFASTPNIDLNKKVSSRPPLYNLGEQSSPTRKHRVPRNTYIPTVYKVETVA